MEVEPAMMPRPALATGEPDQGRWRRRIARALSGVDRGAARARRVLLLVALLGIANLFDLLFTLLAAKAAHFVELNPVAARLIKNTGALVAFKAALVLFGVVVFVRFRRHRLTELACWGLGGLYASLAGRWWVYYFRVHG